jgi:ubiquinone/menaquinone biosynthesis C-methylase UbiE
MRRPSYLTPDNAAHFQHESVVAVYDRRLPYPVEVFDLVLSLVSDEPRCALDLGTGTGDLARPLARHLQRIDAVDMSPAMIARGKALPGGDAPNLRWIEGRAEDVELRPPYALITAGESLHWMDWDVLLPRLKRLLSEHAYLAMVYRRERAVPWQSELDTLISELSTIKNFESYNLVEELERRHLFQAVGRFETDPTTNLQSIDDYIDSFHSRASLSRQAMPPADWQAFDERLRSLVEPWSEEGMLTLQTEALVSWGVPLAGPPAGGA